MTKEVKVVVSATDKASSVMQKIGNSANKLGDRLKGMGAKAGLAFGGLALASREFLTVGTRLDQLDKKASTVFGDFRDEVEAVARDTAKSMGLTKSEFLGAATAAGDLLIPMGFQRKEAAQLSTQLIGLSGALAEWSGGTHDATQVSDILTKALLGERDQLKSLGIAISEADVQNRLLAKGQDKLTGSALEQAKAQATLELIMEKSTDAQKAFEEGGDSMARQQAELRATFNEVKETLARELIPVFNKVLKAIAPVIEKVATWIGENSELAGKLFVVATAVTGVITVLGGLAAIAGPVIGALGAIKGAILLLSGPIGWIIAAVGLLGAAWATNFGGIREKTETVYNFLKDNVFKPFEETIGDFVDVIFSATESIIEAFNFMSEKVTAVMDTLLGFIEGVVDKVKAAIEFVSNSAKSIAETGKESVTGAFEKGKQFGESLISGFRADGGPVQTGKAFVVGERGPEIFVPNSSGNIVPNEQMGNKEINININNPTVRNDNDIEKIAQMVKKVMINDVKNFNNGIAS